MEASPATRRLAQQRATPRGASRGPSHGTSAGKRGQPGLALFFFISLLIPVVLYLGPLRLQAHRLFLLVVFLPLLFRLLSGRGGKLIAPDYLIAGATVWSAFAIFVSVPGPGAIEPIGIYFIEYLGAYMIGRLAIRSAEDFQRVLRFFFAVIIVLIPFAAVEAITHRAFLLEMIPSTHGVMDPGPRMGLRRAQTVFAHPILFGAFVSTALGMVWYALRPASGFMTRVTFSIPVALAMFFSLSSGAFVSFMVQGGLIAWDLVFRPSRSRWKVLGWLAGIAYVTVDAISNRSPFHILTDYTFSSWTAYYRIVIWRWGIQTVYSHPLFGLGANVGGWDRASWMGGSVDNFWLLMTMRYGVPAFLMLAIAIFLMARRATGRRLASPVDQACRTGYLVSLIGLMIAGGTVDYWHTMLAFFMFMVGAGMWLYTAEEVTDQASDQPGSGRRGRQSRRKDAAEPARPSGIAESAPARRRAKRA